jgi:disulfide bond formation protein DsbB
MSMTFSQKQVLILCGLASAALLLAAFGFEHLGGFPPCKLCLWQRWPHVGVLAFCLLGALGLLRLDLALLMIALCALITTVIAGYHVGVELEFWPGPASCSTATTSMSTSALLDNLLATPVVRCDEIAWSFAGISMAGWNMLFSSSLVFFAILTCRKTN